MLPPATRHQQPATDRRPAATPSLSFQVCPRPAGAGLTPSPIRSGSSFSPPRKRSAFTLIELLVVIAIIAILAGLAFPAVQGALESGKKAQARNDVQQIAAAVRAYQLEYGRLPSTQASSDQFLDDNGDLMNVLIGQNINNLNPRQIPFLDPKVSKQAKGGLFNGKFYDPWGNQYLIEMDTNYDNRINPWYGSAQPLTSVIVISLGSDKVRGPTSDKDILSFQ